MPVPHVPPAHKGQKRPPEILTPDEVRALIKAGNPRAPTGIRNRALIAIMYGAGLRLAEALALRPSDINIDDCSVHVRHGKGDKARYAGVDASALMHVARWLDAHKNLKVKTRVLFCTLSGRPLQQRYVRAMLNRYAHRAGIDKRVHPHGLRHTHAAELARRGVPVNEIQDQLGHTSLNTTSIYLRHIAPAERVARISKIGLGL